MKSALEAAGVRYSLTENGYLCLGALFGNIKIQWGIISTSREDIKNEVVIMPPLIAISTEYFSSATVNVAGGTADPQWTSVKPIATTILDSNNMLNVSSNYFGRSWGYNIRWLLIGV